MRDYSVLNWMIENQKSELRTAYDKGYNQGVRDTDFQLAISKRQDEAYKQGLHDAWECMKKICRIIPVDDFAKVFGDERVKNLCDIIMYIPPTEAIEKVKEYDKKTFDVPDNCKIEVGDVVETNGFGKPVIVISAPDDLDSSAVKVMNFLGDTAWKDIKNCQKTGKHIQQIEEVFNMLRDNKNA